MIKALRRDYQEAWRPNLNPDGRQATLVVQLHEGPPADSHLDTDALDNVGQHDLPNIAQAEPPMPSLERMHQIVAEGPRAQAKFFLLMTELHYKYIVGVNRLHIGRLRLAAPREPHHNEVAATFRPCVAPNTTDVLSSFRRPGARLCSRLWQSP